MSIFPNLPTSEYLKLVFVPQTIAILISMHKDGGANLADRWFQYHIERIRLDAIIGFLDAELNTISNDDNTLSITCQYQDHILARHTLDTTVGEEIKNDIQRLFDLLCERAGVVKL